jgi:murein DD-endopeptidase MepM/ murein hydrolase activator NlpD
VTAPVDALLGTQSCAVGEEKKAVNPAAAERQRLQLLASEFESMLLNQVLQEMRRAGKWDESEGDGDSALGGVGNGALFEILDAELAKQLSKVQGFGLGRQLMNAFDRMQGTSVADALQSAGVAGETATIGVAGAESGSRAGTSDAGAELPASAAMSAAGRHVTSGFGWRRDPFTGETRFHRGIDLRATYGEDVATAAAGRVAFAGPHGSYGNTVVVEHANGTRTRFAHLSVALVQEGDTVEPGQVVGRAGSSGRATAPHLHLEVTDRHGRPLNPLDPLNLPD